MGGMRAEQPGNFLGHDKQGDKNLKWDQARRLKPEPPILLTVATRTIHYHHRATPPKPGPSLPIPPPLYSELEHTAKMIIPVRCFSCGKVSGLGSSRVSAHNTDNMAGDGRSVGALPGTH